MYRLRIICLIVILLIPVTAVPVYMSEYISDPLPLLSEKRRENDSFTYSSFSYFPSINEAVSITRSRMADATVNGMPYVHLYNNVWARDTLFSCYGFLVDTQYDVVKNLLYYLWNGRYTSPKGDSIAVITTTIQPRLGEDECIDSTPLWIIISDEYLRRTNDPQFKEFLAKEKCYSRLKKWMDNRFKNGLITQHGEDRYYYDWSDSARRGLAPEFVMYSNILFWKAYTVIDPVKAEKLRENIDRKFWNNEYYRDFIGSEHLSSDGNLLAIIWDFADIDKSRTIMKNMKDMIFPIPTLTVKPRYSHDPWNYQNGKSWGWLGTLSIIAYVKIGDYQNAYAVYGRLSNILTKERWRFSELYSEEGSSLRAPFFIWYSGLFMYALCHLNVCLAFPILSDLNLNISCSSLFTDTHSRKILKLIESL